MAVTLFMRIPELDLGALRRGDGQPQARFESTGRDDPPRRERGGRSVNILEVWQTPRRRRASSRPGLRDALVPLKIKDPLSYRLEPLHNLYAADLDMIERIGATSMRPGSARSQLAS